MSSDPLPRLVSAYRLAFVASIGGFLFGFDLGMIGAANVYLRDQFHLTDAQFGFATASAVLGCILGPGLGAWLCDAISRKRTMFIASALLAVGALFTAVPEVFATGSVSSTMASFNFFRFLGGIGVGLCSVASPMYIAEIAPPSKRGAMGLMYQLAIVIGHAAAPLVAFGIVYYLRVSHGVTESMVAENPWYQPWRWMFFSETVFVAIYVGFLAGLPYSPRWLARKGRFAEAEAALASIDGPEFARREVAEIRSSLNEEVGAWGELFKPGIRTAVLIGVLLTFFNNWTGWSVIGGYIPRLLQLAGFDRESAIGNFVAVYGAMAIMTVASIVLMDRLGRRPLWMIASLMMAVITAATGYMFYKDVSGWPVLVLLGLVTIPHGLALGGIPWLMMSELFPTRLRAKAVALTTTVLWVFIFAGATLFPMITGYSQRHFLTAREAVVEGPAISFEDANPDAIVDAKGRFIEAGFQPKDQITVVGAASPQNNGTFAVATVESGRIVLEGTANLASEPATANTKVQVGSVAAAFYLFSGICILSFLFGLWVMPETKGRTLEEIGSSWERSR
ncbi:MAG: sugar porter family MFS transporter [Pirellulales bacterium]|nr:sugar porter family MFS transporter [Pirellulales bacterium]